MWCQDEEDDTTALNQLQQNVEAHPEDPLHRLNLGKYLWERGGDDEGWKEKAAEQLVMAAKLNPENGEAFKYLGHYYNYNYEYKYKGGGDDDVDRQSQWQRAVKCYERAVSVDPNDSISGEAVCNLLDKQGKESIELALCKEASAKSPRAFWAFSRMGYLLLHQNNWSQAVQSLQQAIRGYPSHPDLWEALGLAYQRLGMYTAAIKSYGRAMELDDSRPFAVIESANIFLMLGLFTKGIEQFRHALEICPHSASANYGLASGLLAMSKESINQGAFAWAISLLEEASVIAKLNTALAVNMSCVWKLYADIQFTYAKYLPWTERGYKKDEEAFSQSLLSWKKNRHSAAVSASCSYQRALHLAPWQANIYMDVAVVLDLICSLEGCHEDDRTSWQPPAKMMLGSLSLEGDNFEFWMSLGFFSGHKALRQHAFIRGLQLDVSLASAWAHLGKLYREEGQNQLGRQAFDRARSIDPSLALPWAGMSADILTREASSDEAYESCLRAVQIMHIAEFQIGLSKLALLSGHLLSPEVFAAIEQAVQCAPCHPESHNLCGLVFEARHDYVSAVSSYKLARYALKSSVLTHPSHHADVSVNLARALYKAGNVQDGVVELEDLKERGMLDVEGLQIYAISLWMLGKNDLALSAVKDLTECVLTIKQSSVAESICLICTLLYRIAGLGAVINSILKIPRELLLSAKVSFLLSAVNVVDGNNQLQSVVTTSRCSLSSHQEIIEMHLLIALTKLVRNGSEQSLNLQTSITHLWKALHMYPNGTSIRNMLGYFLLSRKQCENSHVVRRCCVLVPSESSMTEELRSVQEIVGAEAVACHAFASCKSDCSFSAGKYQSLQGVSSMIIMQRWLHQEPWNHNARYLLILNLLQKAREARYPQHHISVLKRMTYAALNSQLYLMENKLDRYKRFQLLLCASEISLLGGDTISCVSYAKDASNLLLPAIYTFFAHLQLCRAYAAKDNHASVTEEFMQCLKLKTDIPIGWISLKLIESRYKPQSGIHTTDSGFKEIVKEGKESWNSWMPVYNLFSGLIAYWTQDSSDAERLLAEACSSVDSGSSFFLCHGAICMELAKKQRGSQYLTMAMRSLTKAQEISSIPLPLVSLLLAQAEASLGSNIKWENNLHLEWSSWTPEERPAELYFQMHLLSKQGSQAAEYYQDAQHWVLRAIHLNPSCSRYWRILYKLA